MRFLKDCLSLVVLGGLVIGLTGCPESNERVRQTKSGAPTMEEMAQHDAEAFDEDAEHEGRKGYRRRLAPQRRGARDQPHGGGVPR